MTTIYYFLNILSYNHYNLVIYILLCKQKYTTQ